MDAQSLQNADLLIQNLLTLGVDYSAHREQLATEIWWEGFWEGNWDVTVDIPGLRAIRLIQEDEYDQHMGPDRPGWSRMLFSQPEYVWFADDVEPEEEEDE